MLFSYQAMNSAVQHPAGSVEAGMLRADVGAAKEPSPAELARAAAVLERSGRFSLHRYKPQYAARQMGTAWARSGIGSWADYLSALGEQPALRHALRERLSVQHSEFFRNPTVFSLLSDELLPTLSSEAPLRLLSAGCGRGEEAYSLALLLHESDTSGSVEALDYDARAVAAAQRAVYPTERLRYVPGRLRAFFEDVGPGAARLARPVRERVRFAAEDLFETPLMPERHHLVMLRNVCIYLTRQAQAQLLSRVIDALRPGGILVLGRTESPPQELRGRLEAVNLSERVYRKPRPNGGAEA